MRVFQQRVRMLATEQSQRHNGLQTNDNDREAFPDGSDALVVAMRPEIERRRR